MLVRGDDVDNVRERLRIRIAPDLIVLDMLLAGRDGRAIAGEVKAEPLTRHSPIVMISVRPNASQEAADTGADGFIAKPFDLDALLE